MTLVKNVTKIDLSALQTITRDLVSASDILTKELSHKVPLRVFADVMGTMFHAVSIADEKRRLIYVNAAFCAMTGYGNSECLGRNCSFLQGPDTDQNIAQEIRNALNEGRGVKRVILNYRKHGSTFMNHVHIVPVVDMNGHVYAYLGMQHELNTNGQIDIADFG